MPRRQHTILNSQYASETVKTCCNAQADLIGTGKEKKRDAAKREKLHAKWLQQQDATDMEAVVAAMRSGWRRPSRNNGLDGDLVRTWQGFVDSTGWLFFTPR